jgi:hypothetical protein
MLLPPGFDPYAHDPPPDAPASPKLHLNVTSCVTLEATAESLVPVASKNTNSGDIPVVRVTFALNCKPPLVAEQEPPAVAVEEFTDTVTL